MVVCAHLYTKFQTCKPEERSFPAVWVCRACQEKFAYDPNNPKSVRYTKDPQGKKILPPFKSSGA